MNVFLSYSRKDSEWTTALAERLRSAGFVVWDPETELYPGDNWARKIAEALESACDGFRMGEARDRLRLGQHRNSPDA